MALNHRIIWDNGGTLTDVTLQLNNFNATNVTMDLQTADAIYVGSEAKFNHRFFLVSTANTNTSALTIKTWDGSAFQSVANTTDDTISVSGKSLSQSGILSWVPDRDSGWSRDDTVNVTGLTTLDIYDLYWTKITVSAAMSGTTALRYIGHRFADDDYLTGIYPDFSDTNTKTQFESGKTDWNEQLIQASETVIRDLKFKQVLWSPDQILDSGLFSEATSHKTAQVIYTAFGKGYEEYREESKKLYSEAINKVANYKVDYTNDGILNPSENKTNARLYRR